MAWFYANNEFITQAQIVNKMKEMFKGAGETAAADSLFGYSQVGSTIPAFEDILYDIDCLYKVNRLGNALDIANNLDFRTKTAQDAIGKIERLTKLVQGGKVNIRDGVRCQGQCFRRGKDSTCQQHGTYRQGT